MTNRIVVLLAGISLVLPVSAFGDIPPEQCPQPRFTDKAPDRYYGLLNPLQPNKEDLAAARKRYLGKDGHFGCEACHGQDGGGNGPLASQFDPRPRNFACAQTINSIPDGQLFWIIRYGSPGTAMPPHPEYTEQETWQLVLYLRQLAAPK